MPRYRYLARDLNAAAVRGMAVAPGPQQVRAQLHAQGLYVVSVRPATFSLSLPPALTLAPGRLPAAALALFCRQVATMLGAGLDLVRCLALLADSPGAGQASRLAERVRVRIEAGFTLAEALEPERQRVGAGFVEMVRAGEASGQLDRVFDRLATSVERVAALRARIRSAMIYPAIVMLMSFGVVIFLLGGVVPTFSTLYRSLNVGLPELTRLFMAVGTFLSTQWAALAIACGAAAAAARLLLMQPHVRLAAGRALLRAPVLGPLATAGALATLAENLASLLRAGVPVVTALNTAAPAVGGPWAPALLRCAKRILGGESLRRAFEQEGGLFPPLFLELLSVGEEAGSVDAMMDKASQVYSSQLTQTTERLTAALEPVITVVLGGVVGLVALSVIMPLYSLIGKLGAGGGV
jgi:type IV pilus assembly protein PilC